MEIENDMKIKFQMKKDQSDIIGKKIKRGNIIIGEITHYNYLNGYAQMEVYQKYHDKVKQELNLPE